MALGLAASGGPDLALTSTQVVRYIAAISGSTPAHGRTDDARACRIGRLRSCADKHTGGALLKYIAADGASNLRTDTQAALEFPITDGSPHRAA